jgi:hypothetical protein
VGAKRRNLYSGARFPYADGLRLNFRPRSYPWPNRGRSLWDADDDLGVKIAGVGIRSVFGDAYFVYARPRGSRIEYAVRAEEPSGEIRIRPRTSAAPLTLAQLIRLIQTAETVGDEGRGLTTRILDANWTDLDHDLESLEELRGFVHVGSDIYPELGVYFEREIDAWFAARQREMAAEAARERLLDAESARREALQEDIAQQCASVNPGDPSLRRFALWCVHVVQPWLEHSSDPLLQALLAWESGTGGWESVERERAIGAKRHEGICFGHYMAGVKQKHATHFSTGAMLVVWAACDPDPSVAASRCATELIRHLGEFARVVRQGQMLPAPHLDRLTAGVDRLSGKRAEKFVLAQLRRLLPRPTARGTAER